MDREAVRRTSILFLLSGFLLSCGGGGQSSSSSSSAGPAVPATSLSISWAANNEKGVNAIGGGYRIYYATSPGVDTTNGTFIDVPYVSGASAPTTLSMANPAAATYYFRVVAYTSFLPPGGSSIRVSPDSTEVSVVFP